MVRGDTQKALSVVVLAVALLVLLATTEPADAAGRYKTVTKTFSNPAPVSINDNTTASPYPSTKDVSGLRRGKVLDANLTLKNVSHTYLRDLDVLLVGPRGQNALVMSDVGGSNPGVSGVTLTLDDEAAAQLVEHTIPGSGSYQPANIETDVFPAPAPAPNGGSNLSVFDGTNPNGTWNLYVVDDAGGNVGQFAGGWSITIKAKVLR